MTGLWRWKPDPPKLYPLPDPTLRINALIEDDGGELLIAKRSGITRLKNGKVEAYPIPAGLQFKPYNFLRDRHGGLWIGASVDSGLMHVHDGRTDLFTRSDGMSSDSVTSFFEDREGNIWVGTADGLDRFREPAIATISVEQGLSSRALTSVLAARDGSVFLGTSDGLNRWKNGQLTTYGKRSGVDGAGTDKRRSGLTSTVREVTGTGLPEDEVYSLFEDDQGRILVTTARGVGFFESERFIPVSSLPGGFVYSITGDNAGNVWISHAEGLFRLLRATVVERIPWAQLGRKEVATALLRDPVRGGLWLGFRESGVAFFKDGQLRASYAEGAGIVNELRLGPRGALWAATQAGLTRIKDGHVATLTQKNGLPCDEVHWTMEDDDHNVWLYMPCGLVRIAQSELDAWAANPKRTVPVTVFDSSDGVRSHSFTGGFNPRVAKSADGRLWFLPADGVSILDPRHLPVNKLPPPVHIEEISADRKTYWQNSYGDTASSPPRLPPLVRDLTIDYTALSLVVPEKVRFRIKLEGQDKNWRELVNVRHVEYTNLPPKHYRFHVLACNNSGVWNEEGATLDFVIPPAWYQTNWFFAVCVAAFLAMIWGIYELRVRQLAHQFNMRLEERVAERTRIARDLHDTLLQSFQALLLRFQAGINMLAQRPADARRVLEDAVDRASQAIAEGRDAIGNLRMSTVQKNDLAVAIKTIAEELARAQDNQGPTQFQVLVEGMPRELHPILRDEVYRLATEALRNAFRHAAAQHIEVEIRYDEKYFRLRVRDDGKGIPSEVLSGRGREGHYGLPGMRERVKLVGGKLTIWTELGSGTEIEIIIPGARAYVKSTRSFWYFGKRSATETDEKEGNHTA
jgi:signal transduction histidine kinase/ligand-binding sensor domain-containing protein